MTVNGLTKVNVGGTTHAPVSCNPRTHGRVVAGSRASPYLFFCFVFFCFPLPDVWSVISNAGGMGTTGSPQVLLPKLICIWDGYLPANSPSIR